MFSTINVDNRWILDLEVSSHITRNLKLLTNVHKKLGRKTVQIPDGSIKLVSYIGDVKLTRNIVLRDGLYVPDFMFNLISIGKLVPDSSLKVIFDDQHCML